MCVLDHYWIHELCREHFLASIAHSASCHIRSVLAFDGNYDSCASFTDFSIVQYKAARVVVVGSQSFLFFHCLFYVVAVCMCAFYGVVAAAV